MDWFLYDNGLRHERVKYAEVEILEATKPVFLGFLFGIHLQRFI